MDGLGSRSPVLCSADGPRRRRKQAGEGFHGDGPAHSRPDTGGDKRGPGRGSFGSLFWFHGPPLVLAQRQAVMMLLHLCASSGFVCPSPGARSQHKGGL